MNVLPHYEYFAAKNGNWRGAFRFVLTDWPQFLRSGISWTEKLSLVMLSFLSRRYWKAVLDTTVKCHDEEDRHTVVHTTQLSVMYFPLFKSIETIKLGGDGHSFEICGQSKTFPFLSRPAQWNGIGAVSLDHDGAIYQLPWFGLKLQQTTRMTAAGLEFEQTTPYSLATFVLHKQPGI